MREHIDIQLCGKTMEDWEFRHGPKRAEKMVLLYVVQVEAARRLQRAGDSREDALRNLLEREEEISLQKGWLREPWSVAHEALRSCGREVARAAVEEVYKAG